MNIKALFTFIKQQKMLSRFNKKMLRFNNDIIGKLVRINKWVCTVFTNNYKKLKTIINVTKQSINR